MITENELLQALADASKENPEAMTTRELIQATGLSEKQINKALRRLSDGGKLVVHRVRRTDIAGRPTTVPAYTIMKRSK